VRTATVVFAMVAIPAQTSPDGVSRRSLRPHHLGAVVINEAFGHVQWTCGAGSHPYTEWDNLLRFGQSYGWRAVRYTASP
jgi:hypothetical protein